MKGERLYQLEGEEDWGDGFIHRISKQPGAYGGVIGPDGKKHWYCCTPNGHMGNLGAHHVTEHTDGTITVSPSILVSAGRNRAEDIYHGWLERGVWRNC